jgi:hypothetical protein
MSLTRRAQFIWTVRLRQITSTRTSADCTRDRGFTAGPPLSPLFRPLRTPRWSGFIRFGRQLSRRFLICNFRPSRTSIVSAMLLVLNCGSHCDFLSSEMRGWPRTRCIEAREQKERPATRRTSRCAWHPASRSFRSRPRGTPLPSPTRGSWQVRHRGQVLTCAAAVTALQARPPTRRARKSAHSHVSRPGPGYAAGGPGLRQCRRAPASTTRRRSRGGTRGKRGFSLPAPQPPPLGRADRGSGRRRPSPRRCR